MDFRGDTVFLLGFVRSEISGTTLPVGNMTARESGRFVLPGNTLSGISGKVLPVGNVTPEKLDTVLPPGYIVFETSGNKLPGKRIAS